MTFDSVLRLTEIFHTIRRRHHITFHKLLDHEIRCNKLPKCCPFAYWCKHNAATLFASYLIFAGAFVMIILHSGWIKGCNTKCWVKRQNVNETFIQLRNNEIPLARDVSSRGTRVDLLTDSRASLCARPLHICLYYSRDDWLLVHAHVGLYY